MNNKILVVFLNLLVISFLSGCSGSDIWDGHVFPDREKLIMRHSSGSFHSQAECEKASMKMLRSLDALDTGYYECSKNCSAGESYEVKCEEKVLGNYYRQ